MARRSAALVAKRGEVPNGLEFRTWEAENWRKAQGYGDGVMYEFELRRRPEEGR